MTRTRSLAETSRPFEAAPVPAPWSSLAIYRASPAERIRMIKRGIPATEAKRMLAKLGVGQGVTFGALKLSLATVNRKAALDQPLSADESERVIGMAKLIGQLEAMIQESGDPKGFDAAAWISRWLREPLPAFGGACPMEFMDTMEGQAMVSQALGQMQSGAYA
jgi:putative toxin-antitoxin system antitoxin component (TIGR02293 family)